MSRRYEMGVEVCDYTIARERAITLAANEEWRFDGDWYAREGVLSVLGEDSLCGGETEEEFVTRISRAIWGANGGFCRVTVHAAYLEEIPFETHELDEDDYTRWQGACDEISR